MGLFAIVGAIAFANTLINCKEHMFKDQTLLKKFKSNIISSIAIMLVLAAINLFIAYSYTDTLRAYPWYIRDTSFCIMYTILTSWLLLKDKHFVQEVHVEFKLKG